MNKVILAAWVGIGMLVCAAASGQKFVLTTVYPYNADSGDEFIARRFAEEAAKRSNGQLTIKYLGGVEVVPSNNQLEAVMNGVVDMSFTLPGALEAKARPFRVSHTSPYTYAQERSMGIHAHWQKFFKDNFNLYFLGTGNKNHKWSFVAKKKYSSLADLKGAKWAGSGTMLLPAYKKLGIAGINVLLQDLYSALSEGVVEGQITTLSYQKDLKLWEVTKYFGDEPFYGGSGMMHVVNMKKWNSLPPNLQELMNQVQKDLEPQVEKFMAEDDEAARQLFIKNGALPIRWNAADARTWKDLWNNEVWSAVKESMPTDQYAPLQSVYKYPYK